MSIIKNFESALGSAMIADLPEYILRIDKNEYLALIDLLKYPDKIPWSTFDKVDVDGEALLKDGVYYRFDLVKAGVGLLKPSHYAVIFLETSNKEKHQILAFKNGDFAIFIPPSIDVTFKTVVKFEDYCKIKRPSVLKI